jgi:hypothetical protein
MLQYQCNNIYEIQQFNYNFMSEFISRLSYETWGKTFGNYDMDAIFNSFLDTYLKIFYYSFLVKIKQTKQTNIINPWITLGIDISCCHKTELYLSCRNSSDQNPNKSLHTL